MNGMFVCDCNICHKKATIGASPEQLQVIQFARGSVTKGYCDECRDWRMVSMINNRYEEIEVRPIYWLDLDEVQA